MYAVRCRQPSRIAPPPLIRWRNGAATDAACLQPLVGNARAPVPFQITAAGRSGATHIHGTVNGLVEGAHDLRVCVFGDVTKGTALFFRPVLCAYPCFRAQLLPRYRRGGGGVCRGGCVPGGWIPVPSHACPPAAVVRAPRSRPASPND